MGGIRFTYVYFHESIMLQEIPSLLLPFAEELIESEVIDEHTLAVRIKGDCTLYIEGNYAGRANTDRGIYMARNNFLYCITMYSDCNEPNFIEYCTLWLLLTKKGGVCKHEVKFPWWIGMTLQEYRSQSWLKRHFKK
jgi:hypothetical protein